MSDGNNSLPDAAKPDGSIAPVAARNFAQDVVRRLRASGYEAVWAGGCVRDQLLGVEPKDYDVATNAAPNQVRDVFGRRRTLEMGTAFGVITVLGPKAAGPIEIATFRKDAEYSDGRHPDAVEFSSAQEDAKRRDFTINGLFFDPITDQVIDYVGGQEDIDRKIIRAIGSPHERIAEDKLRMLRAIRFAAKLGFQIEEPTLQAVRQCASEIHVVSAERIGAEMRRILAPPHAVLGMQLLGHSGLLHQLAPQFTSSEFVAHEVILRRLESLQRNGADLFATCVAVAAHATDLAPKDVDQLGAAWRLSNDEVREISRILDSLPIILDPESTWPQLQRVLAIDVDCGKSALQAASAAASDGRGQSAVDQAITRIQVPREQWDPPTLLDGNDLRKAGLQPGPQFKTLLECVRDEQLEGRLSSTEDALAFVASLLQ